MLFPPAALACDTIQVHEELSRGASSQNRELEIFASMLRYVLPDANGLSGAIRVIIISGEEHSSGSLIPLGF